MLPAPAVPACTRILARLQRVLGPSQFNREYATCPGYSACAFICRRVPDELRAARNPGGAHAGVHPAHGNSSPANPGLLV